ncbi:MAG: exodeoxyribonuclease V subunit alpha, partial [Rubrivivax sp.]|nr:exodeoxyribonuclease V subunit alpha [Rubrivivax sp.]
GVVGTPQQRAAMPLILDDDDRLYLHRLFDFEQRLARRLVRAAATAPAPLDARAQALLTQLFAANAERLGGAADWQQLATALALRQRLTIISGGPGTGKTTAVVNLLACLLAQDPDCRIALAAPTGKAAARMTAALRQRASHLPAALRDRLPAESFTLHRLLGVTPRGFVHHAGKRLPIDTLVVDEASMLDLALATRLLEAVPDSARIVLLGDKDQLAAVESGAVFAELGADPSLSAACRADLAAACQLAPQAVDAGAAGDGAAPSALQDSVVWLRQNFRFAADSGVGRLATAINQGRSAAALATLADSTALHWLDDSSAQPGAASAQAMAAGFAPYFDALRATPHDAAAVGAVFDRFRVLCALREGPRGVLAINQRLAELARSQLAPGSDPRSPWFAGRPVMVLRNDPVLGLFNGDIGITLADAGGELQVHFPAAGAWRALPPARLPAHETAFALTVHKSQGSEFDAVLVLLPAQPSRVVSRELLYTAVTRARERLWLCAGAEVLGAAIAAPTRRHSGLLARLREAAADNPPPP